MGERWEWVEIIEPRTKEHMYANLTTGECVWDPPPGVKIKKTDDNQWWELFDQNTSRFYYYNACSQRTVWHRPQNCDIIPLAKLQTLKQNTEVRDDDDDSRTKVKREIATQTPQAKREHGRVGSLRSSNATQTSPHSSRRHHRHHHHHQGQNCSSGKAESGSQTPTGPPPQGGLAGLVPTPPGLGNSELRGSTRSRRSDYAESYINGDRSSHRQRRSSQSSGGSYGRQDSFEGPSRPLESPRPQRALVMDLHTSSKRSSGGDAQSPIHYGYSRDDLMPGYARETSQYPDVSQITAVPVTPRPKPRSFPRTNPAYVGVKRDGANPSYKRINIETCALPTAIYNQRFYDAHAPPPPPEVGVQAGSQTYVADLSDRHYMFRHDRSDSDTSHSSYGRLPSEMTDSFISHTSSQLKLRDQQSDSHSSQGSLRGLPDSHSSQGSLRSGHERDHVHDASSSHSSPRHTGHALPDPTLSSPPVPAPRHRLTRRNSEPDYANLPIVAHIRSDKVMTVDDPVTRREQEKMTSSMTEDNGGDEFRSGDSLSPQDYNRQDTPSSVRSGSTQNSTSHTSEGLPDQGYGDDSEDSSVFSSTPSPKSRQRGGGGDTSPLMTLTETQHASLRRKNIMDKQSEHIMRSPALEKSQSLQTDISAPQRPLSMVIPSQSEANVLVNPATGSLQRPNGGRLGDTNGHRSVTLPMGTGPPTLSDLLDATGPRRKLHSDSDKDDIESYLNQHRQGLFGKKIPMENLLCWSKEEIKKPMIRTTDKLIKKEATDVFRLIQLYMGDRKGKTDSNQVALEITTKGWSMPTLRDEIYIQLCRQTTDNRKEDSLEKGWELMGICLVLFPPTPKFHSYLEGYIYRHLDPVMETGKVQVNHFAAHCQRRLERISVTGPKRGLRKPTLEEIELAKKSIFHPSMFGSTLEDVMLMQKDKFPDRKLPWIQTELSNQVLALKGAQTEGIFRVPGDIDEVNALKVQCDQWKLPVHVLDPHVPASLLKLWYRELYEPLIPPEFYEQCINNYANEDVAIKIVEALPHINRMVLSYLIRFLQVFSAEENALVTKMDTNNLAMVMAPNCLRCESEDPRIIFENTRKEMAFIRTLILNLDTSCVDGYH